MKTKIPFVVFCTIFLATNCVSKPNRPDSAICLHNSDGWVCTDSRGDFPETENNLICSTIDGYSSLSKYVDQLELRIRQLERQCK